jgi:CelD/BcsL family acetyltransferase involved in cellulose biosynthesis
MVHSEYVERLILLTILAKRSSPAGLRLIQSRQKRNDSFANTIANLLNCDSMSVRLYEAGALPNDLLAPWRRLMRSQPGLDNPLLSPTWVKSVAAVHGGIEVAVLLQGGIPFAFLPFERRSRQGFPVGGSLSDFQGLIASHTSLVEPEALLHECGLTALHYDHLLACEAEQPWFIPYNARIEDALLIVLEQGFDAYWRSRCQASLSWTRQIERKRRKLAREVGPLRFVWHDANPASLESLINWKRRQLRTSRFDDMFASTWMRPLLDRLIASEAEECQGVLSTLSAGDHLVAVHFGIRNRHTMVSSIPTHSREFSPYSPGALLHVEIARGASERSIHSIDLGRGMNPLKRALGSSTRKLAIGTVDLHPCRRWFRAWWLHFRGVVHSWPMGRLPRHAYRQVRRWINPAR